MSVSKSQTSSVAVYSWSKRSVVWRGHQGGGEGEPIVSLIEAGPVACLWLGHLPEAWLSAASQAGRSDYCRPNRQSAACPGTWCCQRGSESLLHHCHSLALSLHTHHSSPLPERSACVLFLPRRSAAHSGSCLCGEKAAAAQPQGHESRVCRECRASCLSRLS